MTGFSKRRKIRSVWGTTPILSICNNSYAERLLGIASDTLVFSTYYITDRFTYNLTKLCTTKFLRILVSLLVFPWALFKYDIFHFFCDRGILPTRNWNGINYFELFLLHLFKKKTFLYTYGADVRTHKLTADLGHYNCCIYCPSIGKGCVCNDSRLRKNLKKYRKYATEILSMGDMTEYTPGSNNSLFFWPIDINKISYVGTKDFNDFPIKIVHAPNHRHYKGTKHLIDVVKKIKKEGYELELILVERVSNDEAIENYKNADIIAEQFLIGWHGFTAIEAMAIGKPVIAFIRKKEYLLYPEECPIVNANPDNLKVAIIDLIENPEKRKQLGDQGRRYVEKYFSIEAFSERLKWLYQKHGIL